MSEALQQVIVAIVALGAAGLVIRRVVSGLRPSANDAACPNCASGAPCADKKTDSTDTVKPLILVKSKH